MSKKDFLPSSFRDPSGYLFTYDNTLYRQVNNVYKDHYDKLMNSGLYEVLTENNLLISHEEVDIEAPTPEVAYKIIKPTPVPFISYPYEWAFSQLKDAALATLKIQKLALEYDMILKDASAYNIQFVKGIPVLIDTLSLETYQEGLPWVAYRQFCQHFLAPLTLMCYRDIRLSQLLKVHIDGIPLDLASSMLPAKSGLRFSILSHIHLHAKGEKRLTKNNNASSKKNMSRFSLLALVDNLESAVKKLTWEPDSTIWSNYYEQETGEEYIESKKQLVWNYLKQVPAGITWDIGANTGVFSSLANDYLSNENLVVSMDIDPACVELNYRELCKFDNNILSIIMDLTNPSPAIGWENKERMSLIERGPAKTVLALALIHHLAISNNVPFRMLAEFFHKICKNLIIEFVPKEDVQAQRLLASREDIFSNYTIETFEELFSNYFNILGKNQIKNTTRTLYLMEAKVK